MFSSMKCLFMSFTQIYVESFILLTSLYEFVFLFCFQTIIICCHM